jgi:predicted nucleic acid-binding protein
MANPDLVIDTSIIIDHLRKRNKRKSILFQIADTYALYVPAVVEFELFAGATDEEKLRDVKNILQSCTSIPMTSEVAQEAGLLYRKLKQDNQLIEIRDLLIASTAGVHGIPLMTLNTKHFQRIDALNLIAPPA